MSKPSSYIDRTYDTFINCNEEVCPLLVKKALNEIGEFNPWATSTNKNSGMYALTVEDQKHILHSHNERNRYMRTTYAQGMIKSIAERGFMASGESIKFGWDGNILDGQHRLWACVQNGVKIETLVVFGIDPDINKLLPFARPRVVEDILEEENLKFEKWETALLKRIGRMQGDTVDGTTIIDLHDTFMPHIRSTKHWLDKLFKLAPKYEKPMFWQDIKTYAVLCDIKNLKESQEVLGAWFNKEPNCNAELTKDIHEIREMLELTRGGGIQQSAYRVIKLLCLAHQAVQDGTAIEHGLAQDMEWAKNVIFSEGRKEVPKGNIFWELTKKEAL